MLSINHPCLNDVIILEQKIGDLCKKQAEISKRPAWMKKIFNHFFPENKELIKLGKICNTLFDRVEKIPAVFSADNSKTAHQQHSFHACFQAAKKVESLLAASNCVRVKAQLECLTQRVIALQYRMEGSNGGLDRSVVDIVLTDKLCTAATRWKNEHVLITDKQLTEQQIKKLEEASTYPKFVYALLASKDLQDAFFNWILRDNNGVSQFIEFPSTCERLKSTYLAARVGRLGGEMFKMEKRFKETDVTEKILTLPFFIQKKIDYVNILDGLQEVVLNHHLRLTINKVFDIFSNKSKEVGYLEFFESTGITNWNCHEIGSWNPLTESYERVDLTIEKWWEQLPVLETLSKQGLEKRLNLSLKDDEWVACAKSARTTPDMDLDKRHGYFEVAIPAGKDMYSIYPFGNFPATFPTSPIDLALFVTNTLKAKVVYPDENFFYSHRQQATHPIKFSCEQGYSLMNILQKELIKARFGHMIFQFGGENCAYWVQNVLNAVDSKLPNFYKLDFIFSTPLNPLLGTLFNFFRKLPVNMRCHAISTMDTIFGSGRGIEVFEYHKKVYKSHKQSSVRNEFVIYQPGYLHRQIEEGKIAGCITLGNN